MLGKPFPGPVTTLSADIAGPFPAGVDVVKDARYALVTLFSQAVEEGDPADFPLPSYEEGLELLEEEGEPEAEERPSEREVREADDQVARWKAVIDACRDPVFLTALGALARNPLATPNLSSSA